MRLYLPLMLAGPAIAFAASASPLRAQEPPSAALGSESPEERQQSSSPPPEQVDRSASEPAVERPIRIKLPPTLNGNRLAPLLVEATLREIRGVEAQSIAEVLGERIREDLRAELTRLGTSFIPLDVLRAKGIGLGYDPSSLTIVISLEPAAVGGQQFSFVDEYDFGAAERALPAGLAAGITGTLSGGRDFTGNSLADRLTYDFAGFANLGGRSGLYLTYGGTLNLRGPGSGLFERDRIIAFKDLEGAALRIATGDLVPDLPILAGDVEILGVSLSRRYDEIQPLRNIRPTGRRSFALDRPSRIEIYANGALVQTIDAGPGQVDLNQIPALSLTSAITIILEDSTGRRELDSFTLANDIELLEQGLNEFNLAIGMLRSPSDRGFRYGSAPIATGQFAIGLSNAVTAGGHAVLAENHQNTGVRLAMLGLRGAIFAGASMSHDLGRLGYAANLAYRGDPLGVSGQDSQLNIRLDYQSRDYRPFSTLPSVTPIKFDLAADYRVNLSRGFAVSLGGSYFERYNEPGQTYGVFAGVQMAFGRLLTSVTARYAQAGGRRDRGLLATLTMPFGNAHFGNASFDTATNQSRAEFRRLRDISVPEFDYGVIVENDPNQSRLAGQARFANSRFNLDVEMLATQPSQSLGGRDQMVGQFRLQSGVAFADGTFGIGRNPGRGFVMVNSHPSLDGARIDVENSGIGRRAGQANRLGPAVIPQVSGYRPDSITVNVIEGPPGYDIGPGQYVSDPGPVSGIKVKIGSDAFRTVIVTLLTPDAKPLALQPGVLINLQTGSRTGAFTNGGGRAVFAQLAPGRYRAEFLDGDLTHEFVVTRDDAAIVQAGKKVLESPQ